MFWIRWSIPCLFVLACNPQTLYADENTIAAFRQVQVRQFKGVEPKAAANALLDTMDSLGFNVINHQARLGTMIAVAANAQNLSGLHSFAALIAPGFLSGAVESSYKTCVVITYERVGQVTEVYADYHVMILNRDQRIIRTIKLSAPSIYTDFFSTLSRVGGLESAP